MRDTRVIQKHNISASGGRSVLDQYSNCTPKDDYYYRTYNPVILHTYIFIYLTVKSKAIWIFHFQSQEMTLSVKDKPADCFVCRYISPAKTRLWFGALHWLVKWKKAARFLQAGTFQSQQAGCQSSSCTNHACVRPIPHLIHPWGLKWKMDGETSHA